MPIVVFDFYLSVRTHPQALSIRFSCRPPKMELNRTYEVNIVCQTASDCCSFIVVEQFNHNSSQYFQNYYKKLLLFNQCSEWFLKLDYPFIEIGKVSINMCACVVCVMDRPSCTPKALESFLFFDLLLNNAYAIDQMCLPSKPSVPVSDSF